MKKYKFKIHYTLGGGDDRINALNRKCNYIKIKKIFDKSILQVNQDETFSSNYKEIATIVRIIKNKKNNF